MSVPPATLSTILLASGALTLTAGVYLMAGLGAALVGLGLLLILAEFAVR